MENGWRAKPVTDNELGNEGRYDRAPIQFLFQLGLPGLVPDHQRTLDRLPCPGDPIFLPLVLGWIHRP